MLTLRGGGAPGADDEQLALRGRSCAVGVLGGESTRRAAPAPPQYPRGPPLRVIDPARYAAFLREAAAAAEAAAAREDATERARAARDGDAYRTRPERAQAQAQAEAAARERARRNAPGGAGASSSSGDASSASIRPFDASVDYYAVLGVEAGAKCKALRKAYRKAALARHPDKAPPGTDPACAHAAFAELQAAADVLLDKATRETYDAAPGRRTGLGRGAGGAAKGAAASGTAGGVGSRHSSAVASRKPATRRVEALVSLAACCTGGTLRVCAPRARRSDGDSAVLRVDVPPAVPDGTERLFAGEGDGPEPGSPDGRNGDLIVVLRHAPASHDAPFARRGVKDVVLDAPLTAAPRPGDALWAMLAPTPRGGCGAVAAPLVGARLAGVRCVEARLPREGLPDPSAPWHDAEHGDLYVRAAVPTHPAGPPALRCALSPAAILLLGATIAPPMAAAHAAAAAAMHVRPGSAAAVRLRFRRAARGAPEPQPSPAEAAACVGIAAGAPALTWRRIDAPLDDARAAIALLEDEWAALRSAGVIVLHCPDEDDPSCDAALYQPPPPPPRRVQLAVVHTAAVAQRAQPSLLGQIVGASQPRATVVADARYRDWVRLAPPEQLGSNGRHAERWMLTRHPSLGRLLQPCGAGSSSALSSLPHAVPAAGPPARLRVVHASKVAVRAAPDTAAAVLDVRRPGDVVDALAVCTRTGWALLSMPKCPAGVGHMMLRHPNLGTLLEMVPDEHFGPGCDDDDGEGERPAAPTKRAAVPDAEASAEAALRALCGAAHACGLAAALRAAWWRGALLVAVGSAGAALLGAAPGRPPRDAPLPYVVRQSDARGGWAPLERAAAAWPSDAPARGLRCDEAALLPPRVLWAAELPLPQRYWAAECSRDWLRRGIGACASAGRIATERAEARAAVAAAAAGEQARFVLAPDDELCGRDSDGVRRGGCADARCGGFQRPRLRAAPEHAGLLRICAACGAAADQHTALM